MNANRGVETLLIMPANGINVQETMMERQKMPNRGRLVEGLAVKDGHFLVRIDPILSQYRNVELRDEASGNDTLRVVGDQLWARIERPHPTRRQMDLMKVGL